MDSIRDLVCFINNYQCAFESPFKIDLDLSPGEIEEIIREKILPKIDHSLFPDHEVIVDYLVPIIGKRDIHYCYDQNIPIKFIVDRHGACKALDREQIYSKISTFSKGLNIDIDELVNNIIKKMKNGETTHEIDNLTARLAYYRIDSDYRELAKRIYRDNLTRYSKSDLPIWDIGYLSLRKLVFGKYLLRGETPEDMLYRVSSFLYPEDPMPHYQYLAGNYICHSSPTYFNSGTDKPQLASCFLAVYDDSVDGISQVNKDCMIISAHAGGIGLNASAIRSKESLIKSTGEYSASGLMSSLGYFTWLREFITQGGKRNSSFAIFIEPHHPEILEFIEEGESQNLEDKTIFYALWLNDTFIDAVRNDELWYLFNEDKAPLMYSYGEEYKTLYYQYIKEKKYEGYIKARDLWSKILRTECDDRQSIYICYKDTANKLNMTNRPILSSNLCCEIMEPATGSSISACNLISIVIPSFVEDGQFNWGEFGDTVRHCVRTVNIMIDKTYLPVDSIENNERPLGIGIQGLHDAFVDLNIPYDSDEACDFAAELTENMYYFAIDESCNLVSKYGVFNGYKDSKYPKLHFELFDEIYGLKRPLKRDWTSLKNKVQKIGVANARFLALMPTASASTLTGSSPSFEPYNAIIGKIRTGAYEFYEVIDRALPHIKNISHVKIYGELSYNNPLFKVGHQMDSQAVLRIALAMAPFIDQSMSLNHFVTPNPQIVHNILSTAYNGGLKTAIYYLIQTQAVELCQTCSL